MIRVNRNIEAPEILEKEKAKSNGDYNQPEVLDALKRVFAKKCYICENKKITSYNIEHLRPHKKVNLDLKFGWDNLFLACAHCNNIKSDNYEHILDCTKLDVDELIAFRKIGNFAWDEKIEITPVQSNREVDGTIDLLNKVYNGTTAMKKLESCNIRIELRKEISKFIDAINEYIEADGEDKEDARLLIEKELKFNSPFAAFKRWVVRDNRENLSDFLDSEGIKCLI
ncbi:HNH endonuclease [Clostridium botulinum]|uniref:HNH endonuclease n=1 Tax=Clostridium botulinum TaxID=1491 RepID=UPI000773E18D|nr:HNH endonuclease [Clostridium botulinum]MBY6951038.1 HNH endonuclease [Clostridium botulinum]MCR1140300.1 HNH endonuclease [Clostridium botulinum]NEZ79940.1 hypothetical protein [Clostridium botulinum]NFA17955.1 hypothetical protein [Clostridium botulinum]NFA54510.1 hypothetical protein [Clostridium botulinum]